MAGIPMGTNCAPLLDDLFLYSYENEFSDKLIKESKRKLARNFNLSYRYIDDLIPSIIQDLRSSFLTFTPKNSQFLKPQNLPQLLLISICFSPEIRATTEPPNYMINVTHLASVNFPLTSSNIPSAPANSVYASQLIRYARCCSNYSDFLLRYRALVTRLLSQGYKVNRLSNTFKKFYGRHTDIVGQYKKNVCKCLLILSVKMIFIFDGFANGRIDKIR